MQKKLHELLMQPPESTEHLDRLESVNRMMNAQIEREEGPTARRAVDQLMSEIADFERGLDQAHEIGAYFVTYGADRHVVLESVAYHQPNLVVLLGRLANGQPCRLVQHVSQLNVLLTAVPRADTSTVRQPIGFTSE